MGACFFDIVRALAERCVMALRGSAHLKMGGGVDVMHLGLKDLSIR